MYESKARISIAVLAYNQGEFLEAALLSIRSQNVPVEVVVVDPGSTDRTPEILQEYSDLVATCISEPDSGPAEGLNKAFSSSTAPWLYYLNADDMLMPGGLQRALPHLARAAEGEVLYGHGVVADRSGNWIRRYRSSSFDAKTLVSDGLSILQQATFIPRCLYDRTAGFNEQNHSCWDTEMLIDLWRLGARFRRMEEYVGIYRVYAESITGSGRMAEDVRAQLDRMGASVLRGPRRWTDERWVRRLRRYATNLDSVALRLLEGPLTAGVGEERSLRRVCGQKMLSGRIRARLCK